MVTTGKYHDGATLPRRIIRHASRPAGLEHVGELLLQVNEGIQLGTVSNLDW